MFNDVWDKWGKKSPAWGASKPKVILWQWTKAILTSLVANAVGITAGFAVWMPSLADQIRPEQLRMTFSASERRDQIMSLLVLRGVQSPLLDRDWRGRSHRARCGDPPCRAGSRDLESAA